MANVAKPKSRRRASPKPPAAPSSVFLFRRGTVELLPNERRKFAVLTARLRRNPDTVLVIRGHTLGRGEDAANRRLGRQRAEAIAAGLVDRGIPARRIVTQSAGRKRDYLSLAPAQRQYRRRADVTLSSRVPVPMPAPEIWMEVTLGEIARQRRLA
jgi:outer membrane protein OmpA-like peptidoglycan-associated protein